MYCSIMRTTYGPSNLGGDNMEPSEFITLISNIGFPMAMCVFLILEGKRRDTQYTDLLERLRDAIHEHTLIIQRLMDHFGGDLK